DSPYSRGLGDVYTGQVRAAPGPGPGPRTAPEAARHYCVTRSAARLLDVYAAALSHPLSPALQGVSSA
ncbi:glycosyl transferase, partial [Streptomyces vinaceusdrappus]